ncbi:MAG: AAA family ATPase, partial [Planctomycetales bacterium]|nr:AAA family ATPase [Planctomycetales bacterium]
AHDVNHSEMDVAAQVRSALVDTISSERYELWIAEDTQWSWIDGALRIDFKNDFTCQLAKRMLSKDISAAVQGVMGCAVDVYFDVRPKSKTSPANELQSAVVDGIRHSEPRSVSGHSTVARVDGQRPAKRPLPQRLQPSQQLQPSPRQQNELWEQFVQGPSNQLAWTTANLIVSEPGRLSPVVLHGPNGCGKSLLAASVAERLRTVKRMRRVVHMSSEQFTNDFMEGLRGGGLPMFRRKYRDVEALILDDIQFFVGKKSTIGELKHTLDNLLKAGKQVVLTADRSIGDLQALGSDVVGRLRSGMVTPIFPLDEGTRVEVLTRLCTAAGLHLGPDIVSQIASRAAGDGRVLSGIAKRLMAVSSLHAQALDWEQCWNAVYDLVQSTQPVVRIADIERAVCNMFGLQPESLQSANKTRSVSQPRMLAMFLSRKYTPAAYKEIGEYFGKRRHSTVISAEKTVSGWLSEDTQLQAGRGLSIRDAIRRVEAELQVG